MNQSGLLKKATKAEYPFPIRVLMSAAPVVFAMLPLLWLTGCPPEEWPFVSVVFTLSLMGSGTLAGCTALLVTKWLHGYARAVAAKLGIEMEQPENRTPRSSRERIIIPGVISLLTMVSWGLALYLLAFVMAQMGMPPIGTHFSLIALTMLVVGVVGFTFTIGGLAGFFYAVDRHPASVSRFSRQFRNWMIIAGDMGERWLVPGAPTLTGRLS